MATIQSIFGFRPLPVTFLTVVTYVSLFSALLYIHLSTPKVSYKEAAQWGVDVDEAWADLEFLTRTFHPYNSRSNDDVREYLLQRVKDILAGNGVSGFGAEVGSEKESYEGIVELFDDTGAGASNVTFAGSNGLSVYFEGTNIIVYIHGELPPAQRSPILVSGHYDSVSTGYGATDDGTAIVSILQVIKSFTRPISKGGRRIKRGLIVLLNNGEEDFLNGAKAFVVHPVGKLPHAFLNLEGAGAGGRATLFRTTDAEVAEYYKHTKRPFGTILSDDGYKRGLIRSYTDYQVFKQDLGMRGLDVAFWQPRSIYHTSEDDVRHSSKKSLWHMLGGSLNTLRAMVDDTSDVLDPKNARQGAGIGHNGVWFDFFGRTFAVFRLHTLFAITVTLLVVPPLLLLATAYILFRSNKLYFFSNAPLAPAPPGNLPFTKSTRGWRGFTRFPAAFVSATTSVVGLAYLFERVNPMIVYSSQYTLWTSFLGAWWSIAWLVLRGADYVRPSALARGYSFIEQFVLWFVAMVFVVVGINKYSVASGYWVLLYYTGNFLCAWIAVSEFFALKEKLSTAEANSRVEGSEGHSQIAASEADRDGLEDDDETVNEETPLFTGSRWTEAYRTFRSEHDVARVSVPQERTEGVYGGEQSWSKDLPQFTWILQFLLSTPMQIAFVGPLGLFLATALAQTGADGSSVITVYLGIAIFSMLLLLPIAPFMHRVSYHVTVILFTLFVATAVYNMTAFPFSETSRLKVYFQQTVDLQSGENKVHLVGHEAYVEGIIKEYLPSARNKEVECSNDKNKPGLMRCSWEGIQPNVVPAELREWMRWNTTKLDGKRARFVVSGRNTRACKLVFDRMVVDIQVINGEGSAPTLGNPVSEGGTRELRLWSREWERGWKVEVEWEKNVDSFNGSSAENVLNGRIVCLWSDANNAANEIPALEEVWRYLPTWAAATKYADGLVEVSVPFNV